MTQRLGVARDATWWEEGLGILIRAGRITDLNRILEIENASFTTDAWDREIFLGYLRDCGDLFFIAKSGRRICGYAISCRNSNRAELASIAVAPDHREKGIGHGLMQHTLALLRTGKLRTWWLTARASNATAIRFYQSLGFRRTRTVKRYYEDGEDGVRMQLKLDST